MQIKKITLLLFLCCFNLATINAQHVVIQGLVTNEKGEALPNMYVLLKPTLSSQNTNIKGEFTFHLHDQKRIFIEISALGYEKYSSEHLIFSDTTLAVKCVLKTTSNQLQIANVMGDRKLSDARNSTSVVTILNPQILLQTNSLTLSEGLNFSPGLRLENNCQNCGFTQVRLNGLEGPYTQILINNRPVFSALAGVYGLEMFPVNMLERVEVVKGGGSVLYGGNAIAGTVNIVTKQAHKNAAEIGSSLGLIGNKSSDHIFQFNASLVDSSQKTGVNFFGFRRNREQFDANNDGFSEITKLQSQTVGMDAFMNINPRNKVKWNAYFMEEYRRGGSDFDKPVQQSRLAEELKHSVFGTGISWEFFPKNTKHAFVFYHSMQYVNRRSYYGGNGAVLKQGDTITPDLELAQNAFGKTTDWSLLSGAQWSMALNSRLKVLSGVEHSFVNIQDRMPGIGRIIDQKVNTVGIYSQIEYKLKRNYSIALGGRADRVGVVSSNVLLGTFYPNTFTLPIFVPRLHFSKQISPLATARLTLAQGYRAPQAFEEDLHLQTIGGAPWVQVLQPNLKPEKSESATLSFDFGQKSKHGINRLSVDFFVTQLRNPFIVGLPEEMPNGIAIVTKRNGSGALVAGTNIEYKMWVGKKGTLQLGGTLQKAEFKEKEALWEPENEIETDSFVFTSRILRTPSVYGFFVYTYKLNKKWDIACNGVYTGPMQVAHVVNPETEYTQIKSTPQFIDIGIRLNHEHIFANKNYVSSFISIQNILNSYQRDFDTGITRDAGYVFGPTRPFSIYVGLKMGF